MKLLTGLCLHGWRLLQILQLQKTRLLFILPAINYTFIPYFSYMACAWATFFCYGSMMVVSFLWGQKDYRIPYAWKKLSAYIVIVVILFFIHEAVIYFFKGNTINFTAASFLLLIYLLFIMN